MTDSTEHTETKKQDWRLVKRLLPFLKNHLGLAFLSLIFMVIMDVAGVVYPYMIKTGIDKYISKKDIAGLEHIAFLLLIVLTTSFVFQVLFNYFVQFLGQKILYDLRLNLFRHMIYLSNNYFDKTTVGNTLTNITNDVESIREFISEGVVAIAGEILKVFFILGAMMLVNIKLAMLTFIMLPFFVIITMLFRRSIRAGYRGVRKANAQINTMLQESISGIREIIQFNYKEKSKSDFQKINSDFLGWFLKVVEAYALYFPVIEVVSNICMGFILFFAHKAMGVSQKTI